MSEPTEDPLLLEPMRRELANVGRILGPGSVWTKVKKKGRRAPGARPGEIVHHQHSLHDGTPRPQTDLPDVLSAMRCASVDRETRNARKRARRSCKP